MEGLGELLFHAIMFVIRMLFQFFFEILCYKIGYIVAKVVTLGGFPKDSKEAMDSSDLLIIGLVSIIGGTLLFVLLTGGVK